MSYWEKKVGQLREAIHQGALEEVLDALLFAGFDINSRDSDGNTLLHYACQSGILEIIELLLRRGADPNAQNLKGETPLFFLSGEAADALEILLKHGADPNAKDHKGTTPLIYFARQIIEADADVTRAYVKGNIRSLQLLLQFGADPREKDLYGNTFLASLISRAEPLSDYFPREEFYELVRQAIKQGADPNEPKGGGGYYPLHHAVKDPKLVRILLEEGADPNMQNARGETPAHLVVKRGVGFKELDVLDLLKEAGADLQARTYLGRTVGFYYVANNPPYLDVIKSLYKRGVGFKDEGILFYLAERWQRGSQASDEYKKIITFLINDLGLSPNARDKEKNTLLHVACRNKDQELAKFLLNLGAKPWLRNSEEKTPGDILADAYGRAKFPAWGLKLGLLPLKNWEALLETWGHKKLTFSTKRIEAFVRGMLKEDPFGATLLLPHLTSLPTENPAFSVIKKVFDEEISKIVLDNGETAKITLFLE